MKKKVKIPAEVLEQLEGHPEMKRAILGMMDAEGRIEIRDEVWNRDGEGADRNGKDGIALPDCIDTGLTIGDLFTLFGT